jgi:hypothetical protein
MVDDPPYCFLGYLAHYFCTLLLDTCSPQNCLLSDDIRGLAKEAGVARECRVVVGYGNAGEDMADNQ